MDVRVLGALEVVGDDGTPVDVGGPNPRAFVALLALRVGEVIGTDQIIDQIWGEHEMRDPANALQALVSKLRRSLAAGRAKGATSPIVTKGSGYVLDLEPTSVDAVRFERLVGIGRARSDVGDAAGASARLAEALALWRGPALSDFEFEDFAQGDRARLEDLRVAAIEQRIDADLALGRHEILTSELEALIASHPLRERFRGQLMLALYRSGRQADALRAYQATREVLAEELGIDPSPELQRLEGAILAQAEDLAGEVAPTPLDVGVPAGRRAGNLPASVSSFVGREEELATVASLLRDHRLVTLVGPGGVGKTRLALEASTRAAVTVADGAWLVALAAVGPSTTVLSAIETGLELEDGVHAGAFLAERELLLVLDNCEHLVDDVASTIDALLRSSARLRVLATSRERLGVQGEVLYPVPTMAPKEAAELFVDRASAGASAVGAGDHEVVGQICEQLDWLPLAVELAAARTRVLSLDDLSARLVDRFALLTGGDRTADPRQQTLRRVVDWSYEMLFSEEQQVFRRLSVFAGGFSAAGAEAVCGGDGIDPAEVLEVIGRLVDKSLVVVAGREGTTRYGLLQTLVDYGRARLVAAGEEAATLDRHLAWVVALAKDARVALRGPRQMARAAEVAAERANVLVALQHARSRVDADDGLAIVGGFAYGWYINGDLVDGYAATVDAVAHPGAATAEHRAYALAWLGWIGQHGASTTEVAMEQLAEALRLARDASSHVFCAAAVFSSLLLADQGQILDAAALLDEAEAVLARDPDRWSRALVDWARAGLAVHDGELDVATALLRRSIAGFEAEGDELGKAFGTPRLGELAELRGDYEEAVAATASAYATVATVGPGGFQASRLAVRLGNLASLQGDHDAAARWHAGALAAAREGGYLRAVAEARAGMGDDAARRGELDEAEALQQAALDEYRAMSSVIGMASTLAALGHLALARGALDDAAERYGKSLEHATASDDRRAMTLASAGLAAVAAARG